MYELFTLNVVLEIIIIIILKSLNIKSFILLLECKGLK